MGNFDCGAFLNLQRPSDTVNHDIFLKKLEYYGIRDIINNGFSNYTKGNYGCPCIKKESKFDCSNYWPISLLSNIEKILEKLIYSRIYNFFPKNNLIYPLEFGFRQQYSTFHNLVSLTVGALLIQVVFDSVELLWAPKQCAPKNEKQHSKKVQSLRNKIF